jgi:hypothetical protein
MTRPVRTLPVDGAEAGGGQGEQDRRVVADRLGDVFASTQSGGHQSECVAPIEGGTGWTHRLSTGTARFQQHPIREVAGVETDIGASTVGDADHSTRQTNGSTACPDCPDLGRERIEAPGPVDPGQDALRHLPLVVGHATGERRGGHSGQVVGSHAGHGARRGVT